MSHDLIGKRLEFLRAALPKATRLAFLSIKGIPKITGPLVKEVETMSRTLGMTLQVYEVASFADVAEVDSALETIAKAAPDALYVLESPTVAARASHVMSVALKHRLPVLAGLREYVDGGALLFYGTGRRRRSGTGGCGSGSCHWPEQAARQHDPRRIAVGESPHSQ
jgi:ABC-type uncharacterized transport system substrate-binding protein